MRSSHEVGRASAAQRSGEQEGRSPRQVLLIEDHALFRESLALLLELRLGLESVEAGSLAEGRRVLSDVKGTTDFAIIDLDLPDGGGGELIEQLHKTEPDVPIVAFTANRSLVKRARAFEAGADEVLTTMTSAEQIIGAVERLQYG